MLGGLHGCPIPSFLPWSLFHILHLTLSDTELASTSVTLFQLYLAEILHHSETFSLQPYPLVPFIYWKFEHTYFNVPRKMVCFLWVLWFVYLLIICRCVLGFQVLILQA